MSWVSAIMPEIHSEIKKKNCSLPSVILECAEVTWLAFYHFVSTILIKADNSHCSCSIKCRTLIIWIKHTNLHKTSFVCTVMWRCLTAYNLLLKLIHEPWPRTKVLEAQKTALVPWLNLTYVLITKCNVRITNAKTIIVLDASKMLKYWHKIVKIRQLRNIWIPVGKDKHFFKNTAEIEVGRKNENQRSVLQWNTTPWKLQA